MLVIVFNASDDIKIFQMLVPYAATLMLRDGNVNEKKNCQSCRQLLKLITDSFLSPAFVFNMDLAQIADYYSLSDIDFENPDF